MLSKVYRNLLKLILINFNKNQVQVKPNQLQKLPGKTHQSVDSFSNQLKLAVLWEIPQRVNKLLQQKRLKKLLLNSLKVNRGLLIITAYKIVQYRQLIWLIISLGFLYSKSKQIKCLKSIKGILGLLSCQNESENIPIINRCFIHLLAVDQHQIQKLLELKEALWIHSLIGQKYALKTLLEHIEGSLEFLLLFCYF